MIPQPRTFSRAARMALQLATLGIASLASTFARADSNGPVPVNTDPELERQSFVLPEGFEINLFAADPMVAKPIGINFDADGRLWVVSSSIYPQLKPGDAPNDKVIVLEDTTGAGKADKASVYAEGLFIPTGLLPGDGGVYVCNSTEVLFLKDSTGGLKADTRKVALSGFGTEDTHHIIHSMRYGPDGNIYFNQSVYIHSHVETPYGTRALLGSGTWKYRPETARLDVYCRGQVNPWGIAWDEWGQTFETDGAGGEGIAFTFPGSAFFTSTGYDRLLHGMNPGSPKYAGLEIVDGRAMPDDWQNNYLTNDFRANRICRFQLTDNGSGYISRQVADLITTKDRAFRPIDIKMGPDGAIYIADWYNPIINHGEVDFRDPRRDHVHGRIWRVSYKGLKPVQYAKLGKAPVADLLAALRSPEQFTRARAKIVMRERGSAEVLPALSAWVKAINPRSRRADHDRLEALWTYQSLDVVDAELLTRVLGANHPEARAAAVRVLSQWAPSIPNATDLLAAAVADENPRVRLEAVRGLSEIHTPQAAVIAAHVLDQPMDTNLDWSLNRTTRELEEYWMPAYRGGKLKFDKATHLSRALADVKAPEAMDVLVQQLQQPNLPPESRADAIDGVASLDPEAGAAKLFDIAKASNDAAFRTQIYAALVKSGREKKLKRPGAAAELKAMIADSNPAVAAPALQLVGAWHVPGMEPAVAKIAEAPATDYTVRRAAIGALGDLGGMPAVAELRKLAKAPTPDSIRGMGIAGLAAVDVRGAATLAAEFLASGAADRDITALLSAFVLHHGGGKTLASAMERQKVSADTARLALRALQPMPVEDSILTDAFRTFAGLSTGPTKLTPEQMKQTMDEVLAKGNAVNGEKIFRSREAGCFACHAIGGAGGNVGPDLRAIGASSPLDYLVDSILDPNKAIKDGFQGYAVATKDGEVITGIKVQQSDKEITLRSATGDTAIPLASIKLQKDIGSLMPTGLADTMTHQEFLDLCRFLSELGKPGPYGPDTAQYVRRWRVFQYVPAIDAPEQLPVTIAQDNSNWQAAYASVAGELPTNSFTSDRVHPISWARADLDVATAGPVRVLLNDATGLDLWVDGKKTEAKADMTLDLPTGTRFLIFRVDFSKRGKVGLRVEARDIPGSKGHALPVGGK